MIRFRLRQNCHQLGNVFNSLRYIIIGNVIIHYCSTKLSSDDVSSLLRSSDESLLPLSPTNRHHFHWKILLTANYSRFVLVSTDKIKLSNLFIATLSSSTVFKIVHVFSYTIGININHRLLIGTVSVGNMNKIITIVVVVILRLIEYSMNFMRWDHQSLLVFSFHLFHHPCSQMR